MRMTSQSMRRLSWWGCLLQVLNAKLAKAPAMTVRLDSAMAWVVPNSAWQLWYQHAQLALCGLHELRPERHWRRLARAQGLTCYERECGHQDGPSACSSSGVRLAKKMLRRAVRKQDSTCASSSSDEESHSCYGQRHLCVQHVRSLPAAWLLLCGCNPQRLVLKEPRPKPGTHPVAGIRWPDVFVLLLGEAQDQAEGLMPDVRCPAACVWC